MLSLDRHVLELPRKLLAIGWGCLALSGPMALADDGPAVQPGKPKAACKVPGHRHGPGCGASANDGYQGFGLNYHPGYGYGGKALGVGSEGGFPFYGGPGYPHPGPCLNRCGMEKPFAYFGGPGFPSPDQPHFFGEVGPLASDPPVIEIGEAPGEMEYGSGYGNYTGLLPYPESTFAPFTTQRGTAGSDAGVGAPVPPGAPLNPPPPTPPPFTPPPVPPPSASRSPGIEAEPAVATDGAKVLKVTRVQPGGAADQAGLRAGDELHSANNYVTNVPGNLTWIIANAAPDQVLRMSVRASNDGRLRTVNVRLR